MSTSRLAPTLAAASALGMIALASPALASTTAPTPSPSPTVTTTPAAPTTTAPKIAEAKVAAAAHIRYSVNGYKVTLTPYVTGTQHLVDTGDKIAAMALPMSYEFGASTDATLVSGGNVAGEAGMAHCTTKGSTALSTASLSGAPLVFRVPGPGTYKFSMNATVCTGGDGQLISKTVYVTVPGAAKGAPATKAPTKPAQSAPAPTTHGTQPTKPSSGPKVVTDYAPTDDSARWGVAALGGAGLIGAGTILARRRSN